MEIGAKQYIDGIYIYIFIYLLIYLYWYLNIYIYIPKKGSDFGPKKAQEKADAQTWAFSSIWSKWGSKTRASKQAVLR